MRHLRIKGYEADLIFSNEFDHFLPQADTFEDKYLNHIYQFDFGNNSILQSNRFSIASYFSKYNSIIACGSSIAYLTYSNIKIDIVIPYGSDLYNLPFFEPKIDFDISLDKWRTTFAKNQKKGIENAEAIIFDYTNEEFEKVIDKFNLKGTRYKYPCPFIFTQEFNPENTDFIRERSSLSRQIVQIKEKFDFVAFSHIRQSWKNPEDMWSYKGNDSIFKAFKNFLTVTKSKSCLIVFEYGIDVENSKLLVKELEIEQNVIWFPLMQRRDILTMISYIDVGVGEIGNFSWFSYGEIYEFLCMKKPVIHRRDDNLYIGKVESLYPMLSASNEEQVTSALVECYTNKTKTDKMAEEAYNWYITNAIEAPVNVIISAINNKSWRFYGYKKFAKTFLAAVLTLTLASKNLAKSLMPNSLLGILRRKRINKTA